MYVTVKATPFYIQTITINFGESGKYFTDSMLSGLASDDPRLLHLNSLRFTNFPKVTCVLLLLMLLVCKMPINLYPWIRQNSFIPHNEMKV